MIAIVAVLVALPAGYFLRSRLAANTTYSIAYLWAFIFQTLFLLTDSLRGASDAAFRAGEFPLSYGLVTLGIFAIGFGVVAAGQTLAARRRRTVASRQAAPVSV